jgi:hypothetical protein
MQIFIPNQINIVANKHKKRFSKPPHKTHSTPSQTLPQTITPTPIHQTPPPAPPTPPSTPPTPPLPPAPTPPPNHNSDKYILLFIILIALAFVIYRLWHQISFLLPKIILLVIFAIGLVSSILYGLFREEDRLFKSLPFRNSYEISRKFFDYIALICITLVGFYAGFLIANQKEKYDQNSKTVALLEGAKLKIGRYIQFLQWADSSQFSDTVAVRRFDTSTLIQPLYILDVLQPDQPLTIFNLNTFLFLSRAEVDEKGAVADIFNGTESYDYKRKEIKMLIGLDTLVYNQLREEQRLISGNEDSVIFNSNTDKRANDTMKTVILDTDPKAIQILQ